MGTGSNLGGPASHPAPCLWPGKAVQDGPKPWDPAPVWETWLRIGSAPAIVAAWGVSQWMEELPLCRSSSLYI